MSTGMLAVANSMTSNANLAGVLLAVDQHGSANSLLSVSSDLGAIRPECDGVERVAVAFLPKGRGKNLGLLKYGNRRCPDITNMGCKSDRPYFTRHSPALIVSQPQSKKMFRERESPKFMTELYGDKR